MSLLDIDGAIVHWECHICGYLHDDDDAPESCPVCGAPCNKFVERFGDEGVGAIRGSSQGIEMDDFERDLFADYEDQ